MQSSITRPWIAAFAATLTMAQLGTAADHGPVFGLATAHEPARGMERRPWIEWPKRERLNSRSGIKLRP